MIRHFCLYGFLKNQKYFEPFFLLALLQKGLSFFAVGLLVGFRSLCINFLEIPSGAIADTYGRRKCMIISFISYIGSFLLLGLCQRLIFLFPAMLLFGLGEAFRTGTHKAMIFHWLEINDRKNEKTEIYGTTRSWSQYGSAVSSVIAVLILLLTSNYNNVFLFCIIPYSAGIINFVLYPPNLETQMKDNFTVKKMLPHLIDSLKACVSNTKIRSLIAESMGFLGVHTTTKDYIQPVLKSMVVSLPVLTAVSTDKRTAILIGICYFFLFIISGKASKNAGSFSSKFTDSKRASSAIVSICTLLFLFLAIGLYYKLNVIGVICFILIAVLQNVWRPIYIGRLNSSLDPDKGATIMSVDSQARSLFIFIAAPAAGYLVDNYGIFTLGIIGFLTNLSIIIKFYRQ
ncbi:MAG: MFS transporter [Planctomycetota bacterium]|jgi:MFS family permease